MPQAMPKLRVNSVGRAIQATVDVDLLVRRGSVSAVLGRLAFAAASMHARIWPACLPPPIASNASVAPVSIKRRR